MPSIQFNLLPASKRQFVQMERKRALISKIAVMVSLISVGAFVLSFLAVNVIQAKQLSDTSKQIDDLTTQLKNVPNLDKVLTVQNQLQTLVSLHQSKHITSRIFSYLPQVTPKDVFLGSLTLDLTGNTMDIAGTANSPHAVNTFIDTLKFTTYTTSSQTTAKSAFPSVLENSFSLSKGLVNYSLLITFDPVLFANNLKDSQGQPEAPKLNVPSQTTTRSVINDPANFLFNGQNTGENQTQ